MNNPFWLNLRMPQRSRFRLPADSGGGGSPFRWLFFIVAIGVAVLIWWATGHKKPAPISQRPVSPATTNSLIPKRISQSAKSTNAPVVLRVAPMTNTVPVPAKTNLPSAKLVTTNGTVVSANFSTNTFPRPPKDTLEVQVALARRAISSGSIDGVSGSQTRAALTIFQRARGLTPSGELDTPTRAALMLNESPFETYIVTANDLARLQPISATWLGKSQQSALDFETVLELVAEHCHASPTLMRKLNPSVNWSNIVAGTEIKIPSADYPPPRTKAAFVQISLSERRLQAFDESTNLLASFPCSIAAKVEKRPEGELKVVAVAPNPDYTFNPEVFPESEEARQLKTKLILPPGPNNPVGTAWISLDKPGYGMHGTPNPEQVGRTESHGCFRLANWNADYLIKLVWVGMPVHVEP